MAGTPRPSRCSSGRSAGRAARRSGRRPSPRGGSGPRAGGPAPGRTTRRTGRPPPGRGCAAHRAAAAGSRRTCPRYRMRLRRGRSRNSPSGSTSSQKPAHARHLGEEAVAADVEAPAVALDGAADPADDPVGLEHGGGDVVPGKLASGGEPRRACADDDDLQLGCVDVMPRRGPRAGRRAVPGTRRSCGSDRRPARPAAPSRAAARARVMSGRRTVGSSSGRGTCTTALPDPASSQISAASSEIDTSCGLPMLTGPASVEPRSAMTPSTRSSTY